MPNSTIKLLLTGVLMLVLLYSPASAQAELREDDEQIVCLAVYVVPEISISPRCKNFFQDKGPEYNPNTLLIQHRSPQRKRSCRLSASVQSPIIDLTLPESYPRVVVKKLTNNGKAISGAEKGFTLPPGVKKRIRLRKRHKLLLEAVPYDCGWFYLEDAEVDLIN